MSLVRELRSHMLHSEAKKKKKKRKKERRGYGRRHVLDVFDFLAPFSLGALEQVHFLFPLRPPVPLVCEMGTAFLEGCGSEDQKRL